MSEELIEAVADAAGSTIVRVDDVDAVADSLSALLGAARLDGADEFAAAVAARRRSLAERIAAHSALELLARTADGEMHVVTDVAALRSLVERIEAADQLVESTRDDARVRAGAASGLAVHPTSIRDAAAAVVEARVSVAQRQEVVDGLVAANEDAAHAAEAAAAANPAAEETRREPVGWHLTDRDEIRRAAVVVALSLVIGVLVLVLTGSPLALVIPGVAVCWGVVLVVRQRDSAYDEEIARRNLANVSLLTDRAYGGAGLLVDDPAQAALMEALRALVVATDRLAYLEAAWRALVGPDADVDDVDDVETVVRARDAQYGVSDALLAGLPSVRAAAAHRRRLRAEWKLAWWALDRPVPALRDAPVAIDVLEGEGIVEIAVAHAAGRLDADEQARLDELVRGRDEDELRVVADRVFPAVVVADPHGTISEDHFRQEISELPDGDRFVVVAPAG